MLQRDDRERPQDGLPSLSIVMPVYNEAAVIETVISELETAVVDRFQGDIEVLVVDDVSSDATPEILRTLEASNRALRVHRNPTNQGHGASLITAIERSGGEWIFHLDSDRQFDPQEFWDLWEERTHADLVLGYRKTRHDPTVRLMVAKVTSAMVSRLAGIQLRDPNCPFRVFRRETWNEFRPMMGPSPFAPSIMVSLGAARRRSLKEIPVKHLAREHGRSSLKGLRLLRSLIRSTKQTIQFSRQLHRHERSVALRSSSNAHRT